MLIRCHKMSYYTPLYELQASIYTKYPLSIQYHLVDKQHSLLQMYFIYISGIVLSNSGIILIGALLFFIHEVLSSVSALLTFILHTYFLYVCSVTLDIQHYTCPMSVSVCAVLFLVLTLVLAL